VEGGSKSGPAGKFLQHALTSDCDGLRAESNSEEAIRWSAGRTLLD